MTGIERLRELVDGISPITALCGVTRSSYDRSHIETVGARLRDFLADIADQIEREQGERVSRVRVLAVVTKMERHVLGVEGMEDSPVARWARELREALVGHVEEVTDVATIHKDAMEAYEWVEAHGGPPHVKDIYHDFRAVVERLGIEWSESELHGLMDVLDRRLMPEGMEWPRFEDGEPVDFGDEVNRGDGDAAGVDKVVFYGDQWRLYDRYGCEINEDMMGPGERVKRPAPNVLDADGVPCKVGDHGYWLDQPEIEITIKHIDPREISALTVYDADGRGNTIPADEFTHRAPVLAADGKPLREGETVWDVDGHGPFTVRILPGKGDTYVVLERDGTSYYRYPEKLTHERPEIDSWERLEEDAKKGVCKYFDQSDGCGSCPHYPSECHTDKARDIVRRAKALAERDA